MKCQYYGIKSGPKTSTNIKTKIIKPSHSSFFLTFLNFHTCKLVKPFCFVFVFKMLLGALASPDKHLYSSHRAVPSGYQEQHNILPLSSSQGRFNLLPLSTSSSQSLPRSLPRPPASGEIEGIKYLKVYLYRTMGQFHGAAYQMKLLTRQICLADFFGYQPNFHTKCMHFGW